MTQDLLKMLHPVKKPDVLAVAKIRSLIPSFLGRDQNLILEKIQDSFNFGTILRCAEAFGIMQVVCVMQNAAAHMFSCKTVRASMGGIFRLESLSVIEGAAAAILYCRRHGIRVIATTTHCNEDLTRSDFSAPCAVAFGNEVEGLSRELLAHADLCVRIEMLGMVESLNVAVATGVVLHTMVVEKLKPNAKEAKKQRRAAAQAAVVVTDNELEHG